MMTEYWRFKMTIGDWSGDGHGEHDDFLVASNKPVSVVREAHFKIKDATGIDIEDVCGNYEEDEIDKETMEKLRGLGFVFHDTTGIGDGVMNPEEMARLWMFLLQKADPSLKMELIDDNVPTLHFYGFDEKKRHIGFVGYGVYV